MKIVAVPVVMIGTFLSLILTAVPASAAVITPGTPIPLGSGSNSQPVGIAFNPAGTRAYVTLTTDNVVDEVDTSTGSVVATIPVGSGPLSIAILPDGSKAYVSSYNDGAVTIINLSNNTTTTIALPTVGSPPNGFFVALTPDASEFWVVDGTSGIDAYRVSDNAFISTISVASGPVAVAFDPTGTKAYVADYASMDATIIDVASHTVTGTFAVPGVPYGVAFSPDGATAYVSDNGGTITPVDAATDTPGAVIPTTGSGLESVTFSPDGTRAYVPGDGAMQVIDVSTNTLLTPIPVGAGARLLAMNAAGTFGYVSNTSDGTITPLSFAPDPAPPAAPAGPELAATGTNAAEFATMLSLALGLLGAGGIAVLMAARYPRLRLAAPRRASR
ncbi:MAG TPA: YncE family protein [Pseudolysinimonas sp.]